MATHHQAYPAVFWQKQEVLAQLQLKSWVQHLDTAIANITAVSLNFFAIVNLLGVLFWKNIRYSPTICCVSCCADN